MRKLLYIFLLFPTLLSSSDISEKMGDFLREYNTGSSFSAPQMYKGQMAGYVTNGNLTTRNTVFNRKPLTISPPSYSVGCAGIDAHMGSFSFMGKEEMVDALKSIASNAATYSFLLTLKSMSPQADDTMRWIQEMSNKMNAVNINSCEIAEQAVAAIYPQTVGASQHICRSMKTKDGLLRDQAWAKHNCASDNSYDYSDEETGDALVGEFNVAWEVIQKDPLLSNRPEFAELFMSITGTLILKNDEDGNCVPEHHPSMVQDSTFMKNLFEGGTVDCYRCRVTGGKDKLKNIFDRVDGCLNVSRSTANLEGDLSLHSTVKKSLDKIQDAVSNNTELNEDDKAILTKTNLPVARIICALTAYNRGRSPVEISTLSEIITVDIVCQYLKDVIRTMRSTAMQFHDVQMNANPIDTFIESLKDVEKIVMEYETKGNNAFDSQFQTMKMLELIENDFRKNISL